LVAQLRGDLDWVVMKALEKDRDRRYETASALAADLGHYLAGEPVNAAAPSRLYRTRKFVRRNKGAVFAAAVVLAGLIAGIIGTSIGLVSQSRQRVIAERERAEIQLNYAVALQAQRRYTEAEALYRKRLRVSNGDAPVDKQREAVTRLRLAETVNDRAGAAESEPLFREALAAYRDAFPAGDPNIAHALNCLAQVLRGQSKFVETEALFREAYDIRRQASPIDHRAIGESAAELTNVLITLGRHEDAEPIARRSIEEHEVADPRDEWALALARVELGRNLMSMGKFAEAEMQILEANRQLAVTQGFQYGPLALAALYTRWNEAEPGRGHDAQAREWFSNLIGTFVGPTSTPTDSGD
jgi:tetratricopeptide (TPR) repeat protein